MDDVPSTEEAAPSLSVPKKKAEATSETLENMTRVTPAQSSSIYFPLTNRYLPVRSDPTSSSTAGKKGAVKIGRGGAGILMVYENSASTEEEQQTDKEFIELEASLDQLSGLASASGATVGGDVEMGAAPTVGSGTEEEDGPEREPPASFEVSLCFC